MEEKLWYVPKIDPNYEKFGNYETIEKIVMSRQFFPTWITGNSGYGKTKMIEQVCANEQREYIRVNFNIDTDEKQLLGGFRLKNGNTEFEYGPVVVAMKIGAILLLDEIDVGHVSRSTLVLQSILEGNGVLLKDINEWIEPSEGFQIFATSNTRGRGSDTGEYVGTNIMNQAFLDRFCGTIVQKPPEPDVEKNILKRYYTSAVWKNRKKEDIEKKEVEEALKFIYSLVEWANSIRSNYNDNISEFDITTRALINIINSYNIFQDNMKAIEFVCERFDEESAIGFVKLYQKMQDG